MAEVANQIHLHQGQGIAPFKIERAQTAALKLGGQLKKSLGSEIKARLLLRNGQTFVRARIGPDAPAGTHKATLVSGKTEHPVVVEIPKRAKLRAVPSTAEVTGRPGQRVQAKLTIRNAGNVDLPIPSGGVAGLFASDGLAGAFSAAYGSKASDPLDVFGEFIQGLRKSHLGLVTMRFTSKTKTPLAIGESRDVVAEFTLPKPQQKSTQTGAGRRFHATFVMDGLRLVMRLTLSVPTKKGDVT